MSQRDHISAPSTLWKNRSAALSLPLAAWIAVKWFVPFYRRYGHISAYAHLEQRFGLWARSYAGVCYLLTQLARMASILYLVAMALQPLTGWSVTTIILITGVLVTVYTMIGGIEAVIWTDVVQSVVLTAGAVVCVGLVLFGMPEGPGQVFEIAAEEGKFSLGSLGPSLAAPTFWVVLVYGLVINLQNFGIDQSFVQRYHAARSEKEAGRSVWLAALLYLPISGLLFFVGTGLFAFYSVQPELLPEGLAADKVFPHFIATELPTGATGLLVAAIFAAAMSSIDTSLNSSSTLILEDLYKRYVRPVIPGRESMIVLHMSTLALGLGGTLFAIVMMDEERNVLDVWWDLAGLFAGGMLGLFLLGMIARSARAPAAIAGVVAGLMVILWMTLSPKLPEEWSQFRSPFNSFLTVVFGTVTILFVGLLMQAIVARRNDAKSSE